MAQYVTSKIARHFLKESAENRFGTEDPYFEHISPVDMDGRPSGKPTKRKRAIPPGLTKKEEKVLKKVTRRAYRLDNCINVCGIRVGWSAIVAIIPGLGDVFDTLMAMMVLHTALGAGLPADIKSRMVLNIILDFFIGLVPFIGDIGDAVFRANTRNAALLYKHLQARGAARIAEGEKPHTSAQASTAQPLSPQVPNVTSPSATHPPARATPNDAPDVPPPAYQSDPATQAVRSPQQARTTKQVPTNTRSNGSRRGFLDRVLGSGQADHDSVDLENGDGRVRS